MKLLFDFENGPVESITNIGFAKAIIEVKFLDEADLYEIGQYLLIYCEARAKEKIPNSFECQPLKGGAE